MSVSDVAGPTSSAQPTTTVPQAYLGAVRVVWLILSILVVTTVTVGSGIRYVELRQVCTTAVPVCFALQRLSPVQLTGVVDTEGALQFHALFFLIVNGLQRVSCWGIALLLFRRRSDDWIALLAALYLLVVGNQTPLVYIGNAYPVLSPIATSLTILSDVIFGLFLFLFPNGHFVPTWTRWAAWLGVIYSVANGTVSSQGAPVWWGVTSLGLAGIALYAQVYRYRRVSNSLERQQTKWVVLSVIVWALLNVITTALVITGPGRDAPITPRYYMVVLGFNLTVLAIPIGLAVAILRYRLYDIDIILNRTLVYGALTGGVIGIYALVVGVVGTLLQASGTFGVSLLGAGAVALVFQPLRDRLQRAANRLMYGERGDPYTVLARFGHQLEAVPALETLLPSIAATIHTTLRLPYVAIQLVGESHPRAAVGVPSGDVARIPLLYAREQIGDVLVAPRVGETGLSPIDRRLLDDLARQAGVAVHAVRVTAELQRSREQLVTTREEERKRLRRDLHDGLGPALATMTLQADTARGLVRNDPGEAETLLESLTQQAQTTMKEVRSLIHALRPPVLDDLGLEVAVRSLLTPLNQRDLATRLDVADGLPPLSAAVELALYRITQEALNNVVKHAQAHKVSVRLAVDGAHVALEVADDGRGIATDRVAGVGLASMRERAEELGGTCVVESEVGGGTRVVARLPIT